MSVSALKTASVSHKPGPKVQAKLRVNEPGDVYEQEADAMADRVMRMTASDSNSLAKPVTGLIGRSVQRKCAKCEEEEKQKKVMRKERAGTGGTTVSSSFAASLQATKPGGSALPVATRSHMENAFGADFSGVRIHADSGAAAMSKGINARAFTTGNHIYFNESQFQPQTDSGKHLLAHELTHTLQQKRGENNVQRMIQVNPGVNLDTMGYTVVKTGNLYSNSVVVKSSIYNEIVTSLLNSDRSFKLAGKTNDEANASLKKHIAARVGVVEFAAKKEYTFAAGAGFTMNEDFWVIDHATETYNPKPGVDRQKAIEDLNVNPNKYKIGCEVATTLTVEGGGKSSIVADSSELATDWVPGDWGYIENTKFPRPGGIPGTEGENLIYAGKDKFWGHLGPGKEYKTLQEWFDRVKGWNAGALITNLRKYPKAGLE
jgi:hypothetical protein